MAFVFEKNANGIQHEHNMSTTWSQPEHGTGIAVWLPGLLRRTAGLPVAACTTGNRAGTRVVYQEMPSLSARHSMEHLPFYLARKLF